MQMQNDLHEMRAQQKDMLMAVWSIQSFVGLTATRLPGRIMLGCITLVDATRHEYPIPVYLCTSFQLCLASVNCKEAYHQII